MNQQRTIAMFLGAGLWALACFGVAVSGYTIYARTTKPAHLLVLQGVDRGDLTRGDMVYLSTGKGLRRIGEVTEREIGRNRIMLAIEPGAFRGLNRSTRAVCWRTPLSAEQALHALLPPAIQREAAERIAADWQTRRDLLAASWGPMAAELASSFWETIGDDLNLAISHHERELWRITAAHGRLLASVWPDIQESLQPILQEHLTPVLGRLIHEAIAKAPKVSIAWEVALGNNEQALGAMLDWMTEYLAHMPENDRAEMSEAILKTVEAARHDPVVVDRLSRVGRSVLEDDRLRDVLADIYREAFAENSHTAAFLQREILDSPRFRQRFYRFVELFAPTARRIAALCLFDEQGVTRPEIVHLVRSIALRREVSWVTLETPDPAAEALRPGDLLLAGRGGQKR